MSVRILNNKVRATSKRNARTWPIVWVVAASMAFVPLLISNFSTPALSYYFATPLRISVPPAATPLFEKRLIANDIPDTVMVHSATLTELPNGNLMAVWFQGSREGAPDVDLNSSIFDRPIGTWSAPLVFVERVGASTEIGRRLKTIGNPVLFTDSNARTWLFFVTVSLFGWSGGDVNFKYSDDSGQSWTPARRLELAPIPHSGTLVRGTPVEYADGTLGLPVYRDYAQFSYPEMVRINRTGGVLGRVPMSNGVRGGLQPSVVELSDTAAAAFLRYNGDDPKRVLRVTTEDGGQTWSSPVKLELPNPDSALAALRLSDGSIIIVFNNSTLYRNVLSIAISYDEGSSWKSVQTIDQPEQGSPNEGPSYPSLLMAGDGEIHLLYTWKRQEIRHIVFNEAWARSRHE